MMRMKLIVAVAILGAVCTAQAMAAPVAPQTAVAEAAKALSPVVDIRHKRKLRKAGRTKHAHRRHYGRRLVLGGYYYGDGYYYAPVRRHHRRVLLVQPWCPPPYGYGYYVPRLRYGGWIYPTD